MYIKVTYVIYLPNSIVIKRVMFKLLINSPINVSLRSLKVTAMMCHQNNILSLETNILTHFQYLVMTLNIVNTTIC